MGRYQRRLFNSVFTSDLLSEAIRRKEVTLFQVLRMSYDVVKVLIF